MMPLKPQIVKALALEYFKEAATAGASSQNGAALNVDSTVEGVAALAQSKGLLPRPAQHAHGANATHHLGTAATQILYDHVQMILWQMLAQGVIVWGLGGRGGNSQYPWFRLTDHGATVIASGRPQPYDPDGFLAQFKKQIPTADSVTVDYLEEAVRAFNANCFRAAAVLLGAASEKEVLILHDRFGLQITDAKKKASFDSKRGGIHGKYRALKDRLDRMEAANRLSHELAETVRSQLPVAFDAIRNHRNAAGHPDIGGAIDPDTVFLNLRSFIEYARRVVELSDHFKSAHADW